MISTMQVRAWSAEADNRRRAMSSEAAKCVSCGDHDACGFVIRARRSPCVGPVVICRDCNGKHGGYNDRRTPMFWFGAL